MQPSSVILIAENEIATDFTVYSIIVSIIVRDRRWSNFRKIAINETWTEFRNFNNRKQTCDKFSNFILDNFNGKENFSQFLSYVYILYREYNITFNTTKISMRI